MDEKIKQIVDLLKEKEGDKEFLKAFTEAVKPVMDAKAVSLAWIETPEGKSFLDSEKERHFSKALETWKGNNLEKLNKAYYDERVVKEHPPEDPKDKQLRELKERLDKADAERERYQLTEAVRQYAEAEAVPVTLVPFLLGADEESSKANVQSVKKVIDDVVNKSLEKEVKSRQAPGGGEREKGLDIYTEAEIDSLSQEQIIANRDKVERSMQYLVSQNAQPYKV
jgi:hypothetical protein